MTEELRSLLNDANTAAALAYAPYSNYRVGAAVLTSSGIFCGANIENASSNLGICAERVAICHALMHGETEIVAVAVCCLDASSGSVSESMPCGGCRQWLAELAPNALIVTNGSDTVYRVSDLLPHAFKLPCVPDQSQK
jgi:cytidine deaminase